MVHIPSGSSTKMVLKCLNLIGTLPHHFVVSKISQYKHIQFLLKYTYKYTYAHLARGMIIFSINGLFVTLNCIARHQLPAKGTNVITFNNEL